jgi:hypothetical protein
MILIKPINSNKLFYLCIGIELIILILGCEVSRVLLPEIHGNDTEWLKTESTHYFIYCRPGSPASENIDSISNNLDSCFVDVLTQLVVDYRAKIHYYLYNSKQDLEQNTNRDFVGFANSDFECIAQICSLKSSRFDAHESAHVIASQTLGEARIYFLDEGTAEAIAHAYDEVRPGRLVLHDRTGWLHHKNELFSLEVLTDNTQFSKIRKSSKAYDLYTMCGSFVRYLIDRYSLEQFKLFYPRAGENNYIQVFHQIYGKSITDFEKEWHEFLKNY